MKNLDHDRAILHALGSVTIPEFAFFAVCSEQSAKLRLRALLEAGYARRHPDDAARRSERGKRPLVYAIIHGHKSHAEYTVEDLTQLIAPRMPLPPKATKL